MTKTIDTAIIINAPAEKVWKKLMNFTAYAEWNPFIIKISGEANTGAKIMVNLQPEGASPMTFAPTVLQCKTNELFVWKGKLFVKGLFDGEHRFEIIDNHNGSVTFKQSEVFNGLMVGFFNLDNTKKGFENMNQALKEICEVCA